MRWNSELNFIDALVERDHVSIRFIVQSGMTSFIAVRNMLISQCLDPTAIYRNLSV